MTKGQDRGVTRNPWIEAAVHGLEAHFIANKDEIQAENFSSEEKAFCLWTSCLKAPQSTRVSIATHLKNCVTQSRISYVACLAGVLWWFMTMPAHTLLPQRKILSRHLAGNNSIIPRRLSAKWFSFFLHLKSFLAGRRFHDDEVKEAVTTCFASQAASFYNGGIQKLVQRYDKCLNNGENYVEK